MKSGFVELIAKRALGGRTIQLEQKAKRYKPIESFKKYLGQSLPEMEMLTQINLLKKSLVKIKDSVIRKQLINSYMRRLFRLKAYEKQQMKHYKQPTQVQTEPVITIVDPTILKKINQHTSYDIGFYCLFSNEDMNKAFKHGCFGRYTDEQYGCTEKFGIQIRQQSISIAAVMKFVMKKIEKEKNKQSIWQPLFKLKPKQRRQYINNQQHYPMLFMDLSHQIYKQAQHYRKHEQYNRVWGSSVITDIITNSLLQSSTKPQTIVSTAQQIVHQIMKIQPLPSSNDFSYRFKTIPGTADKDGIKTKIFLTDKTKYYCRTPSFKSFFLGGEGGTGKSMILAYLSMFGYKNGWIIINVPNVYKWTFDRKAKYIRAFNGLYLINEHAVEWLDQFITANRPLLESRSINEEIYGKCDITGVSEKESEPVPNIYYEDRKTYFNEIGDKFGQRVQGEEEMFKEQAKKRIRNILAQPKNVYEIGVAGIKNPEYATCAMGQILTQVYNIKDIPIIECVDSFSYLYRASYYPSFRYYNDRDLWGHIPPYHIAHCRLFVHLDGHKLPNGIKIVTSSNYPMYMHKFNIKKMLFPENYEHKVRNLTQDEFKNAGQFNIMTGWWQADEIQRLAIQYAYTLTQGNWGDFQELMRLGHYY